MKNLMLLEKGSNEGKVKITYGGTDHAIYSIDPPETLYGYTYFSHLIPPMKPETVLILGYAKGTVSKLIKKIWGDDIKVTGVDVLDYGDNFSDRVIKMDARDYVYDCSAGMIKKRFDYVVVDLWEGYEVPDFIFTDQFAKSLKEITKKFLAFNIPLNQHDSLNLYLKYGFNHDRLDVVGNSTTVFFSKQE
jgi:hypothetical protein